MLRVGRASPEWGWGRFSVMMWLSLWLCSSQVKVAELRRFEVPALKINVQRRLWSVERK